MKYVTNDSELNLKLKSDKNFLKYVQQQQIQRRISGDAKTQSSNFKSTVKEKKALSDAASVLAEMISSEFKALPEFKHIYVDGMFASVTTEADGSMRIHFADRMWKENKFKTHISFVPILWEKGWSVHHAYIAREHYMGFNYYAGSNAISTAISKFNKKYAKDGIYASFMLGDTDINLVKGRLPYKN